MKKSNSSSASRVAARSRPTLIAPRRNSIYEWEEDPRSGTAYAIATSTPSGLINPTGIIVKFITDNTQIKLIDFKSFDSSERGGHLISRIIS
ncbi:hypothetical protein WA026_007717 [Henosepilachna vigintioctopunctata]|uniref:Uncharacterized protein n=1 Tax=Henosepilachna vigintioctopunctata TaxID=420089 RepID=A0AAW1TUU9_9CUCU